MPTEVKTLTAQSEVSEGDRTRALFRGVVRGWYIVVAFALLGGAVSLGYSAVETPEYQSTSTLYVTSGTDDNSSTAYQGSLASQQRVSSYTRLARSEAVIEQALRSTRIDLDYDSARRAITSSATPDTVLLNIVATHPNRTIAADLANAVGAAMTTYVSRLETPSGGGQPLAKLTLISPARPSSSPVTPRVVRNLALGVVVGVLLGLGLVLARLKLSTRVRDEADVANIAPSPVLASVPRDPQLKARGILEFKAGGTAAAEAFRKLRTNLAFVNVDNPPRVVLVTSAIAVEGKTTTAMNLAASLVESQKRVVLVDADLRRPQVDARTGVVGEVGLTNFLRGDGELNDLVQPTQIDGLWILASGPKPPNPAELLGTKRAHSALTDLAESFDYVIVDSPPVLPVTDAVVVSQWVDGVLLVARSGSTRVGDLRDAYEQISTSQTTIVGFVLTEAPTNKARYGYYAVKPKQKRAVFGRKREPKAIEQVLEPKRTGRH